MAPTPPLWLSDTALLIYIALATVILHLVLGNRYGIHRDELATLEDARHLAWGYPAYPPVTPFFGRISLELFGTSIRGFRFFAGLAQAIAVVLTGLMARDMGARRGAQLIAAVAAVPFCLGGGYEMQYVAFDCLAWVSTAYFIVRLLISDDPRWWVGIGVGIGFGMLSKYTIGFFALSIVAAVLLTDARRYLKSKWLWIGVAISVLIWLPNLLWQLQHNFVSLDFLRHIHARDVRQGRTQYFLPQQLELTASAFRWPWLGFISAWLRATVSPSACWAGCTSSLSYCSLLRKGAGTTWDLRIPCCMRPEQYGESAGWPRCNAAGPMTIRWVVWTALAVEIVLTLAFWLPTAPLNSRWWAITNEVQGDFREQIGWPELVQEAARIRDSLAPEDKAHLGIIGTNYGEAGAVNLYGPEYGLPRAISGVNSFWYRGYGDPPPQTLIVIGLSRKFVDEHFESCRLAGHTWNQYGIQNEETVDHPDIFVCGPPKVGWPEFWKDFRYYG